MFRYKIITIILMILLLAFSIYFYFYTENLNNQPLTNSQIQQILKNKTQNKQNIIDNLNYENNIYINKDLIINNNILDLKYNFKNENIILSPLNNYFNLYITNQLFNEKITKTDLTIFGNTNYQIEKSINLIFDKIINSDKDNISIKNYILIDKEKLFNEEKNEILKNNFKIYTEQLNLKNKSNITKNVNNFYLNNTNDLLKNFINNNLEYKKFLSTSTILFDNKWYIEYNKTNKLNDLFYGETKTNNITFLQSPINKYYENNNLVSIEKEYINGTYSFRAIMTKNENKNINELLDLISIQEIRDLFAKEKIFDNNKTVGIIPEFKIETFTEYNSIKEEKNYQKIYFSIDRYGSILNKEQNNEQEIIKPENKDNNHIIKLNRPFIFFIWNNEFDIPIFIGAICNL